MSVSIFENGVLVKYWNDSSRTYTEWNSSGVQTSQRPYTAEENARADSNATLATEQSNRQTIETALFDALTTLQAIIDDTNTNVNANPAVRIKDLARVLRRAIRLIIRRFDGTS